MKRKFIYLIIGVSFFCILFSGCSGKEEDVKKEKGAIEKMTDQAAEAALDKINDPLNKARSVQEMHDKKADQVDEVMEE